MNQHHNSYERDILPLNDRYIKFCEEQDSNLRRVTTTDLQSAALNQLSHPQTLTAIGLEPIPKNGIDFESTASTNSAKHLSFGTAVFTKTGLNNRNQFNF